MILGMVVSEEACPPEDLGPEEITTLTSPSVVTGKLCGTWTAHFKQIHINATGLVIICYYFSHPREDSRVSYMKPLAQKHTHEVYNLI